MTFPLFLLLHLAYGAACALATERRMRSEGEVLSLPLIVTLAPVALISAPIGAALLRFAGGWFLHGFFVGDNPIAFERFHFGLMIGVGVSAGIATVLGNFVAIAALSRESRAMSLSPFAVAIIGSAVVIALDSTRMLHVGGPNGPEVWTHPVMILGVANVLVLFATWVWERARLAEPMAMRTGNTMP